MAKKKAATSLGNEEKKALIDRDSEEMSVTKQCNLLGLNRTSVYYEPPVPVVTKEEIELKNAIDKIHHKEPAYGVRRIQKELRKNGYVISRHRVRRYMEEMCINAFYPGPNLSKRDLAARTYPYLLRNAVITKTNQVWGIDITYCGTPNGFIYLVAIIDWHSRFIVGWSISNTITTDFVVHAVEAAIRAHGKPEIINSDQGSQFTAKAYIDCIKSYETIKISIDGKGRATDNAYIERFFRSLKWERLYLERPETVNELKSLAKEYVEHYNYDRPHQSLEYQNPADIYMVLLNTKAS